MRFARTRRAARSAVTRRAATGILSISTGRFFGELRRADPSKGAKPVVHAHAAEEVNVDVDDEGAFIDIDTPEDYERIRS